jgi:hypothetical protein
LKEIEELKEPPFDSNLHISDFEKIDNKVTTHYIYEAMFKILSDEDFYEDDPFKSCQYMLKKVIEVYPGYNELKEE